MFWHNYRYRLKCMVRDKQTMFWTFLFPILLATLFNMAFSNILGSENFSVIKVGVVNNDEYRQNPSFMHALDAVSGPDENGEKRKLFDIMYISKEEADQLLNESKIAGYIFWDHGIKLVAREAGINQSIIKAFLDEYQQTASTMETIIRENPAAIQNGLLESIADRTDYLKEVAVGKSAPNTTVIYFYSLIAMACLYGSLMGVKEVAAIQADLSPQGARVNIAPTHKLKLFMASIFAAATIQLAEILVLLGYLQWIVKIDFGNQLSYILLTCVVGTITGVTFGTCIAAAIKKGEGLKIAVLIVGINIMVFLAGMMYHGIKYAVQAKVPILAYLNPANLIADSFYSLYYYDTYTRFFVNIGLLCIFAGVFSCITYLIVRRQKYGRI